MTTTVKFGYWAEKIMYVELYVDSTRILKVYGDYVRTMYSESANNYAIFVRDKMQVVVLLDNIDSINIVEGSIHQIPLDDIRIGYIVA